MTLSSLGADSRSRDDRRRAAGGGASTCAPRPARRRGRRHPHPRLPVGAVAARRSRGVAPAAPRLPRRGRGTASRARAPARAPRNRRRRRRPRRRRHRPRRPRGHRRRRPGEPRPGHDERDQRDPGAGPADVAPSHPQRHASRRRAGAGSPPRCYHAPPHGHRAADLRPHPPPRHRGGRRAPQQHPRRASSRSSSARARLCRGTTGARAPTAYQVEQARRRRLPPAPVPGRARAAPAARPRAEDHGRREPLPDHQAAPGHARPAGPHAAAAAAAEQQQQQQPVEIER